MSTRKYAMMKLAAGDYLLPSNDHQIVWRICVGEEANERDAGKSIQMWELWRWRSDGRPVDEDVADSIAEDHSPWTDHWELCETGLRTRTDAVVAAMRRGALVEREGQG